MGCSRSQLEPLICASDEEEFLKREQRNCEQIQEHMIRSGQCTTNYGFLNIDTKTNSNFEGTSCNCNWIDKLPELIGGLIILVFVIWFYRKWNAYKRHLAIHRAVVGNNSQVAIPTVAGTLARKEYSYLDNCLSSTGSTIDFCCNCPPDMIF